VPANDEADAFARVIEPIEEAEMAFARDAEDVVGALGGEGLGEDFAA